MLNTNREFYVIFQNRAGDKIKPQMRESPAQIRRVGMSVVILVEMPFEAGYHTAQRIWFVILILFCLNLDNELTQVKVLFPRRNVFNASLLILATEKLI